MLKKIVGIMGFISSPLVFGQTFLGSPSWDLYMEQAPAGAESRLIGGNVVGSENYPGVFYTRQNNSRCTGTLIGSRVVATAAHCVANGGTLTLNYKGKLYASRCTRHSAYGNNATADWALCLLNDPIEDAIAESINTDAARLKVGGTIVLMGFGCINSQGNGGNDGNLRTGSAPIVKLPAGSNYDIVTKGSSALCYGDSGGPSFYVDSLTGMRYQTGINSRGNIRDTSYLSSLHNNNVLDFYRSWADEKGVKICGLHEDAEGCLQAPQQLPEACLGIKDDLAQASACATSANMPEYSVCTASMERVQACIDARQE